MPTETRRIHPQDAHKLYAHLAQLMAQHKICAWIDESCTLDVQDLVNAGVDVSALLISQPDSPVQADEIVRHLSGCGAVDYILHATERVMSYAEAAANYVGT